MIAGQSVVALVPARAGSKGLPGKNTLPIAGRPLIAWTILAAVESEAIDRVVVSSDDPAALAIAADLGATPLHRPAELATDSTAASEVVRHALESGCDCDILVLLQPTSPLRTSAHIDRALALLAAGPLEAVVSVCETQSFPEFMYRADEDGRLQPVMAPTEQRRQDLPTTYILNGAIYAASARALAKAHFHYGSLSMTPYVMTTQESIDIDDAQDFDRARKMLEATAGRPTR